VKPDKRILFISKGENASSTRYRALQFFPYFTQHGYMPSHVMASGGFVATLDTLWQASRADVVVVLRKTFPLPLLWLLRRVSRRLIFDMDDAVFCNSDGSPSATRMKRFSAIAKVSDYIFAGNQFLAEKSVMFNAAVGVIPTSLDVEKYNIAAEKPSNRIDLVWIGSRSTKKYLEFVLPALELSAARLPGLTLKIVADFDLPNSTLCSIPIAWSSECEGRELASAHIGIAPMIENDWTRGKCALKVLQYMAAGLPVVSSRAGVNAEIVQHGETGFLVTSPEEWADAIEQLALSPSLREKMGRAGRVVAVERYSRVRVFASMRDLLAKLN
jgi:glycosyltransferase involved in cell wall biosynthesis